MRLPGHLHPRILILFAIALAASLAFAKVADEVHEREWDTIDTSIELAVHKLDSAPADVVMRAATTIGSVAVVLPVVILTFAFALWRRQKRVAWVLVISSIVAAGGNVLLKLAFSRARPTLFDKIARPESYSFPSGHTMNGCAVLGMVAAAFATMFPKARTPIILAAVPVILLIGISRIYLGVHWPSDVLGAFFAAVPVLVVGIYLLTPRAVADAHSTEPPARTTVAGT